MIRRASEPRLLEALEESPAVALLGPRQAGKTTLALEVARTRPSLHLDLESPSDRARLDEPEAFLAAHHDELVPDGSLWAIEVKRSLVPKVERGFHAACQDLSPARKLVVYPGTERWPLAHGVEVIGLAELCIEVASASKLL